MDNDDVIDILFNQADALTDSQRERMLYLALIRDLPRYMHDARYHAWVTRTVQYLIEMGRLVPAPAN